MERLEQARTRLDRALERLEAAQQALDDRLRVLKAAASPHGADWQDLLRAVEAVQKENHDLIAREEKLRSRLDKAIARLSAMLGEGAQTPASAGRGAGSHA
jgi:DNA repair ATPase RecN